MEHLSQARKVTEKSLLSSALSRVYKTSQIEKEISNILIQNRGVPRRISDSFRFQCLLGPSEDGTRDSIKDIVTPLIHDMVEQISLSEMYRKRIVEIQI